MTQRRQLVAILVLAPIVPLQHLALRENAKGLRERSLAHLLAQPFGFAEVTRLPILRKISFPFWRVQISARRLSGVYLNCAARSQYSNPFHLT
jgi:hypothetical protein